MPAFKPEEIDRGHQFTEATNCLDPRYRGDRIEQGDTDLRGPACPPDRESCDRRPAAMAVPGTGNSGRVLGKARTRGSPSRLAHRCRAGVDVGCFRGAR